MSDPRLDYLEAFRRLEAAEAAMSKLAADVADADATLRTWKTKPPRSISLPTPEAVMQALGEWQAARAALASRWQAVTNGDKAGLMSPPA